MHIEQLMYEQHFVFKNIKNNDSNQTIRKVYIRLWIYWLHKQFVSENRKIFRFTCKTRETKRKYNERKKDCLCVLKWYSQTSKPKPFFHRINWWSEMIALNVSVLWIYWFFAVFSERFAFIFIQKVFCFAGFLVKLIMWYTIMIYTKYITHIDFSISSIRQVKMIGRHLFFWLSTPLCG